MCTLTVNIFRSSESDVKEKTFLIRYVLEASVESSDANATISEIQDTAAIMLMPYIRANISVLTSISGASSITLPYVAFE
jgi:hypothetical protein